MSWNEPGNGRDPWGNNQKPAADLDELIRHIQQRMRKFFGSKSGGSKSGGGWGLLWIIPILVAIWFLTGLYRVDSAERAVVLRFGAYQTTTGPGLHWYWPWPIGHAETVNVARVRSFSYSHQMLTADENIVKIAIAAQYVVKNPLKYLFAVRQPDTTLAEVVEGALRQVIGRHKMNYILGKGQSDVAHSTEKLAQSILDRYKSGLNLLSVNLQEVQPPREVQDAFDDVNKAREDKQRLQNKAYAYANTVVPKAEGTAARIKQDAQAYKAQVVAEARGRASRFESVLEKYRLAPDVTRRRLYIDKVQSVLKDTPKLLVDPEVNGSLLYMPLDKLFGSNNGNNNAGGSQ